jgi:geranylgeranyl pyrophosphate synthase
MTDAALAAWTAARLPVLEAALAGCFADAFPPRLQEACRYPISTGGKRIRPLLCLAAAEAVGGDWRTALPAAVALELLHTYSLVHDDLPCMDDDDERRGRPTVHKVYGEGVAVLVGDALLTEAFAVLAAHGQSDDPPAPPRSSALVRELARAGGAAGMIAGQGVDIGMDGPVADVEALVRLHRAKTGALLRASVRMGAIAVGADAGALAALSTYGDAVGLAFQVQDDVLDADQDAGDDGPPSFVKLFGLDGARAEAARHATEARAALAGLPSPAALEALARRIVERTN